MGEMISIQNLRKVIDKKEILRDVSFVCKRGEKVGLLGPNGAGKTTTFMTLCGFYKPDGGRIIIEDENTKKDITYFSAFEKAKEGIAYLPQKNSFFDELTVYENFLISCELARVPKKKIYDIAKIFGIEDLLQKKTETLSGGERRKAEIARVCLLSPKFLILDEPFAGIDPKSVSIIADVIQDLSKNMGIIISDHNVRDALKICDRVYLIYEGKTIEEGTPQEIIRSINAKKIFFGEGFEL